jgi:hypothetical protein
MTKPRERETEAATSDQEPQVRPEVIQDLDLAGDDADKIAGGCPSTKCNNN